MEYLRKISWRNSANVCRVSLGVFTEFLRGEKMLCANLCKISRSFLSESSRLRIFVRGVNAKKELFFLG